MPQTVLAGAAAPVWKSGGLSSNGAQQRYRVNTALRKASDISLYPFMVEILVRMSDPGVAGLPTAAEKERLAAIEEKLVALVGARAVFAGTLTAVGVRRYWWYTENAELATELEGPLRDALKDVSFDVQSMPDQDWKAYRFLLKGERRKLIAVPALAVMLLLLIAWALLVDGPYGAAVEALMVAISVSAVARLRKGAQWCLDHQRLMFGLLTSLMGGTLFPFVSTILVGMFHARLVWAAFAVAIAVSAALVGSMWKLQLRQWREQVPGSPN